MLFNNKPTQLLTSSKGKSILFAAALMLIPAQQATATSEYYSTPGIACQPANLAQAINLNASWNHIRVYNPNALGGASFFVTCPVTFGEGTLYDVGQGTGDHDIFISIQREAGSEPVTCTARHFRREAAGGGGQTLLTTVTGDTGATTGEGVRIVLDSVITAANGANGLNDHVTVLCALPPQTGVNAVHFDYDN